MQSIIEKSVEYANDANRTTNSLQAAYIDGAIEMRRMAVRTFCDVCKCECPKDITKCHYKNDFIAAISNTENETSKDEIVKDQFKMAIGHYNDACNAIVMQFSEKHEFDFEDAFWVGDTVGGVYSVSDYFVDMQTMIDDLKMDAPENEFIKWYDYCLRAGSLGITTPNFKSYLAGCPIRSDDELTNLEALQAKIEGLKNELEKAIKDE